MMKDLLTKLNPSRRLNILWVLAIPLLLATASSGAADIWGMLSLAVALIIGGLALARVFTSWWDLNKPWKAARFVGCAIAGIGFYFAIFVASEGAPTTESLPWIKHFEEAKTVAAANDKPMMVDFTAEWCKACDELEAEVFLHSDVSPRLRSKWNLVKIDIDQEVETDQKLYNDLKFGGLPAVAFLTRDGEKISTFEGKIPVEEFQTRISAAEKGQGVEEKNDIGKILREQGLLAALLLAFAAGLLASLTPCVYPLIPITIGIFGASKATSKFQGFLLSLAYVGGIAVTYTLLGVTAAMAGSVFGSALQNAWVLGGVALLFVVLGLSSMGLFEMRLPGNLQTKLSQTGGAGYAGAFMMGLVAGIIAAPCVGPIVAGILVYVAQQQDPMLGAMLLFAFSIGMGQLFILLGTFSSLISRLPQSGGWLDAAKVGFAALFWGVALYYGRLLVPGLIDGTNTLWSMVG